MIGQISPSGCIVARFAISSSSRWHSTLPSVAVIDAVVDVGHHGTRTVGRLADSIQIAMKGGVSMIRQSVSA
jgi:hypothetical protein